MSCNRATAERRASARANRLAGLAVGTGVGALLAAAYGALVVGTHVAVTGRWDGAPAFAVGMTVVGAAVGLVAGLVSVSLRRRARTCE